MSEVVKTEYKTSTTTANAFKNVSDTSKSKADLSYERNTYRKKTAELNEALKATSTLLEQTAKENVRNIKSLIFVLNAHEDMDLLKDAENRLWKHYERFPEEIACNTKDTTGEKTTIKMEDYKGKGGVITKCLQHFTPNGAFYKRAKDEKDEPCFFMKKFIVNKENFSIDKRGELKPIKKY
jgi:hypothetical protein